MFKDIGRLLFPFTSSVIEHTKSPSAETNEGLEKAVFKKILSNIQEGGFKHDEGNDVGTNKAIGLKIIDMFVVIGDGNKLYRCQARDWSWSTNEGHRWCKISDYSPQEDGGKRTVFFYFNKADEYQRVVYSNEFQVGHNQKEDRDFPASKEAFLSELLNASSDRKHTEELMREVAARGTIRECHPVWINGK